MCGDEVIFQDAVRFCRDPEFNPLVFAGSVSDSDDDGGAGRATRRGLRPSSRRGRGLSDGGESSGGYGRRARGDEEAPSTSRFGRVIKRKRE